MQTKKQGNTEVPLGKRTFTGNFNALLNHDNKNTDTKFAKRQAKKQLQAYLKGHEFWFTPYRGKNLLTPQAFA